MVISSFFIAHGCSDHVEDILGREGRVLMSARAIKAWGIEERSWHLEGGRRRGEGERGVSIQGTFFHYVDDRFDGEGRGLLCARAIIARGMRELSRQLEGGREEEGSWFRANSFTMFNNTNMH